MPTFRSLFIIWQVPPYSGLNDQILRKVSLPSLFPNVKGVFQIKVMSSAESVGGKTNMKALGIENQTLINL